MFRVPTKYSELPPPTTMSPEPTTVFPKSECSDFTNNKCFEEDETLLILALKETSTAQCQNLCNGMYQGDCHYFSYDADLNLCSLWKDFQYDACQKYGGPLTPTATTCSQETTDPGCQVSLLCFDIQLSMCLNAQMNSEFQAKWMQV